MNIVSGVMAYEAGMMPPEDIPKFFQQLIDTGMIDHLQGSYGRIARELIREGLCRPSGEGTR